jgi:hypothetical protein
MLSLFGIVGIGILARYSDGPIGPFTGGPLQGEVWDGAEPDWTFARDLDTVELQFDHGKRRSGLTGVIVQDGILYVPTTLEPLKGWNKAVLKDNRVILRIDGRLYPRCAVRVTDPHLLKILVAAGQKKYGPPFHATWAEPYTWYWRMDRPEQCFGGPRVQVGVLPNTAPRVLR